MHRNRPAGKATKATRKAVKKADGKKERNGSALDFVTIVDRYKDAVVNIEVIQDAPRARPSVFFFSLPWDQQQPVTRPQAMNIGTGFVFDERGYILTNEHVIHGASKVMVQLSGKEKAIPAKVVGTNYDHDLAVLKISLPKPVNVLRLGKSNNIRVGEWVLAIGNPMAAI